LTDCNAEFQSSARAIARASARADVLFAAQRILYATDGILDFASSLVGFAICLQFDITRNLANGFFDRARRLQN
jgi:hypothetical protein